MGDPAPFPNPLFPPSWFLNQFEEKKPGIGSFWVGFRVVCRRFGIPKPSCGWTPPNRMDFTLDWDGDVPLWPNFLMIPSSHPESRCLDWEFRDNPVQVTAQNPLFSPQVCSQKLDLALPCSPPRALFDIK